MSYFECCRICTTKRYPGCSGHCEDYKSARMLKDAENQFKRDYQSGITTTAWYVKHQTNNLKVTQVKMKGGFA